jgi:uncharacterized repeat protein (TIGR01451 family)
MNAVVTNALPSTITLVSAVPSQGTCTTNAGGIVTCQLGALNNGGNASVAIVVKTTIDGAITNVATVASERSDLNLANNTATAIAVVNPQADVSIVTMGSPDPVTVSNDLSYIMIVQNLGPSRATGLTITNTLPGQVTYRSNTTTHGSCSFAGGNVICNIPALARGERATISIYVSPPTMEGMLTDVARVDLSERDANRENNVSTFVSRVSVLPALALKIAGTNAVLSWPTSTGPFTLQSATSLNPPANWQVVTNGPTVINSQNVVTQRLSGPLQLYRLIK